MKYSAWPRLLYTVAASWVCLFAHFEVAHAADKRLAVLEFQGKKVDEETLKTFCDAVRGGALDGLPSRGVDVMTRENMIAMLKAMGKRECNEGECEVETARNIGADFVVSGAVVRIEDRYVVTLKLHESQGGSLLGTDMVKAKTQLEVLDALREHGRDLVKMHLGRSLVSDPSRGQDKSIGDTGDFATTDDRVLVKFESEPWGAAVLVDGQLLCRETPCSKSVMRGRHEVEMHKEFYQRAQQTMDAKRGTIIGLSLPANFATLSVQTVPPGLPVAVDGKTIAMPGGMINVEPGQHEFVIDHPCYQRAGEQIAARAGERRELQLTGVPRQSAVSVTAENELKSEVEAQVRVDGVPLGTTPGTFTVDLCSREILVTSAKGAFRGPLRLIEKRTVPLKAHLWGDRGEPPASSAASLPKLSTSPSVAETSLAIPAAPQSTKQFGVGPLRVAGIACAGVGLISMGVGLYYYTQARSYSDKVSTSQYYSKSDYSAGKNAETLQWVFYSVGGAAVTTGVLLFIFGQPKRKVEGSQVGLTPVLTPAMAGLAAQGSF